MSAATTCPAGTGPIPQIIHQSWRTHELPSTLRPLSASWSHLSGWRHRLWTDDENRALWAAHFPELLDVYDGYARPVQRADATRLLNMHVHGGSIIVQVFTLGLGLEGSPVKYFTPYRSYVIFGLCAQSRSPPLSPF